MSKTTWKTIYGDVIQQHPGWLAWYEQQGIEWDEVHTREAFNRLPVLKKRDLPRLQREHLPFAGLVQEEEVSRIFSSPGPIYDPQGDTEDYWHFAPLLHKLGVGDRDIVHNTFSYHLSPAGFMFDSAARTVGAKVIPAGTGQSESQLQIMRDVQPTVFAGTPGFLIRLLQLAEQKGVDRKALRLSKAIFTAEKITADMDRFFRRREIQYMDAYGTADAGCLAYREQGENAFTVMEHILLQICDPVSGEEVPAGEPGEVVISKACPVYPLLRFGTGDLSRSLPGTGTDQRDRGEFLPIGEEAGHGEAMPRDEEVDQGEGVRSGEEAYYGKCVRSGKEADHGGGHVRCSREGIRHSGREHSDEAGTGGEGVRFMAGMQGRVGNSYKVKGMFVHAHQLQEAMSRLPEIVCYQALIDHNDLQDRLVIKVEVEESSLERGRWESWCAEAEQTIRNAIRVTPELERVTPQSLSREEEVFQDRRR